MNRRFVSIRIGVVKIMATTIDISFVHAQLYMCTCIVENDPQSSSKHENIGTCLRQVPIRGYHLHIIDKSLLCIYILTIMKVKKNKLDHDQCISVS